MTKNLFAKLLFFLITLMFISKAFCLTTLEEDFNSDTLSSNWVLLFDNATKWDYELSNSNLVVKDIIPVTVNPTDQRQWSTVTLSQEIPPLNDFNLFFNFSWDSENSKKAMQNLQIALFDNDNKQIARVGYYDAWVGDTGEKYAQIGSSYKRFRGLPHKGSAKVCVHRNEDTVNISWEDVTLFENVNTSSFCKVVLYYQFYSYRGISFLGTLSVDLIKIEYNEISACIDTDFDGVIDLWDKCPNTSKNNLYVDKYGCPPNFNSAVSGIINMKGQPITNSSAMLIQSGEIHQNSDVDIHGRFKFDKVAEEKPFSVILRKKSE